MLDALATVAPGHPLREGLDRILQAGAARANEVASRTLADVYERVGFVP